METTNSENMKEAIIKYKPDIVLTNEMKKDKPATDIIKEIQDDITQFQPIFIIHSGYPTFDIERTCSQKGIHAYSYFILDKEIDLAVEIRKIANGKQTKLTKHLYYSFSDSNVNVAIVNCDRNKDGYINARDYRPGKDSLTAQEKSNMKAFFAVKNFKYPTLSYS